MMLFSSVSIRKCSLLLLFSKAPAYFLGSQIVCMHVGCLGRCKGRYQLWATFKSRCKQVRYRQQIRNVHQDPRCKSSLSSVSLTSKCSIKSACAIFSFWAAFGKPSIIHPQHKIHWISTEMKGGSGSRKAESSVIHQRTKVNKESAPRISRQVRN